MPPQDRNVPNDAFPQLVERIFLPDRDKDYYSVAEAYFLPIDCNSNPIGHENRGLRSQIHAPPNILRIIARMKNGDVFAISVKKIVGSSHNSTTSFSLICRCLLTEKFKVELKGQTISPLLAVGHASSTFLALTLKVEALCGIHRPALLALIRLNSILAQEASETSLDIFSSLNLISPHKLPILTPGPCFHFDGFRGLLLIGLSSGELTLVRLPCDEIPKHNRVIDNLPGGTRSPDATSSIVSLESLRCERD